MDNAVKKSSIPSFFIAWLAAGTLDALAAIFILAHGNAKIVFLYIAGCAVGSSAFQGGMGMVITGVMFHYLIAGCFTAFYFFVAYPYVPLLRKNLLASIILYGLFTGLVMDLLVLPLTRMPWKGVQIENIIILFFTVGLPLSWIKYRQQGKI